MKTFVIALLTAIILSITAAFGQEHIWSDGSAQTIAQHRFETGFILAPARYGVTDSLEISTNLLWEYFVPMLGAKNYWGSYDGFLISSTHSIYSPTPFLRFVSKEKTGGLLPPDNYVPVFLVFDSYLLASHEIAENHFGTVRVGGKFAFAISDQTNNHPAYERLQTIDYPFVFPRTAFLTMTPAFAPDGGVTINGPLMWRLHYEASVDFFRFSTRDNLREEDFSCWAIESSAVLKWHISHHVSGRLGMIYSAGTFPFGSNRVLYPLLDIQIGFGGATPEEN
jgi:hypothetical protein